MEIITNIFDEAMAVLFRSALKLCARFLEINKGYNHKSFLSHIYIATMTTYAITIYAMGFDWAPLELWTSKGFKEMVFARAGIFAIICGIADLLEREFANFEKKNGDLLSPSTWEQMYAIYVIALALPIAWLHYRAAERWAIGVYQFAIAV